MVTHQLAEPEHSDLEDDPAALGTAPPVSTRPRMDGIIVWAVISLGFLGYLTFGSIQTRAWQLNAFQQAWVLEIEPRRVLHVWTYQLDHLPVVSHQWLLKGAFGAALVVIVIGVVASIWLMLDEVGTGRSTTRDEQSTPPTPSV